MSSKHPALAYGSSNKNKRIQRLTVGLDGNIKDIESIATPSWTMAVNECGDSESDLHRKLALAVNDIGYVLDGWPVMVNNSKTGNKSKMKDKTKEVKIRLIKISDHDLKAQWAEFSMKQALGKKKQSQLKSNPANDNPLSSSSPKANTKAISTTSPTLNNTQNSSNSKSHHIIQNNLTSSSSDSVSDPSSSTTNAETDNKNDNDDVCDVYLPQNTN